ncbi:hypothetical protein C0966_08980 [Bacillus methanolicus]|uniref:hypothetical protein n=1 Tax=Bacillus methanolicus TaxID=1471 RepID=UPI0023807504|nr:hypothetical protein [Bacillus methanolicus]MDE3839488.1 hypothetical protein [Bacillus methanolicus]
MGALAKIFIILFVSVSIGTFAFLRAKRRWQQGWTKFISVSEVYQGEEKVYPFDWIKEIDDPWTENPDEEDDFDISKLSSKSIKSAECLNHMSEVCFFFAAPDVIQEEKSANIFRDVNPFVLDIIMKELVPHYKEVKQFFIDGKFKEIQLSELKDESKELVNSLLSKGFYPVVSDLYRGKDSYLPTGPRNLKYFLIKKEAVTPLYLKETERIKRFVQIAYFDRNKSFNLMPVGWKLEENLRDSLTIRSFYSFAKQIVLLVDTVDDSVLGLYIFG